MSYNLFVSTRCNVCIALEASEKEKRNTISCNPVFKSPPNQLKKGDETKRKLLMCSGCQLIRYCSAGHQKLDWPLHRQFCHATKKLMKAYNVTHPFLLNGAITNAEDFNRTILNVKYLIRSALDRKLEFHEEELTSFPILCNVCYKFKGLYQCPRCGVTSYCSIEHEKQDAKEHKKICVTLKIFYCHYKLVKHNDIIVNFNDRCDLKKTDLRGAVRTVFHIDLPPDPTLSADDYYLFSMVGNYSCIATIAYTLSFCDMENYVGHEFVIYIVGATVDDIWLRLIHTRFFFFHFPRILILKLFFIGPEIEESLNLVTSYEFLGKLREIHVKTYKGFLEQFTSEVHLHPSMIVSYNCGFSENAHMQYEDSQFSSEADLESGAERNNDNDSSSTQTAVDTWFNGIFEIIFFFGIPIVFTSFTRLEAEFDLAAFMRVVRTATKPVAVERIIDIEQNPYRDIRPFRNWKFNDSEAIYYRNGYIQAVRTRLDA